ncbi:TlpA disulfide reductase family protein [Pedobacter nutrimenti]|uniref:TlpA family protein disulfide reductase n=1 Tax=Pedobacter nutrimenti TaxID=1241337 RepID=UPI00292F3796|nr:TlpA disulfide reductase family protein [Pedobacter nutrimenti]
MKTITKVTGTVLFLLFCAFNSSAQVAYLDVNEKVDQYPTVEWLKGAPVTKFEKDKIYLIELWATWCKPCIAAMPHLSELNSKFKNKIIFIAQDVWEDDLDKVKEFIAENEKMMDFRIGYSGGKVTSDFHKNWIKPSGTFGIPRTFIVQNNTLVWMTSPDNLNEEILQLLVDHKFSIEAAEKLAEKNKL